jgi:hypothetical protein
MDRNISTLTVDVQNAVEKGIKTSERFLILKDGILLRPTRLNGLRRLIVRLTSDADIGAEGEKTEIIV